MSSFIGRIAAGVGFSLIAGVSVAQAQVVGPVEFTTSFPFTVGHSVLPAGSYTIAPAETDPMVLEVSAPYVRVFVEAQAASAASRARSTKTEVVFSRDGDDYVLTNVWVEGTSTGLELVHPEVDRDRAKSSR